MVIEKIENLLSEFTPNPIPFDSKIKLDDSFLDAFDHLRLNIDEAKRDETIKNALLRYREERHYSNNISTLLYYFLHYLNNFSHDKQVRWDFYSRLTLDLEKLLTDVRSFLDSVFKLALLYSNEGTVISSKGRESFGKFAEWIKKNNVEFNPPLCFMKELVPWGLTVRQVRDDYVHRGQEAQPFWGEHEVYFNPYWNDRKVRRMPDLFYAPEHPNRMRTDPDKPIYLRKFIVYIIAPVLAAELVLGRYFDHLFEEIYDPWPRHGIGYPYLAGPHIQAVYDFIEGNSEVLAPEIYRETYFI